MASPKSIGSQRILLVTAGPWGVVFIGLIERCYKGAAGVLPCLAEAYGNVDACPGRERRVFNVEQEQPTRVRCTNAAGISITFSLGRVLPGQRDGSLLWHKSLVKFLSGSSLQMKENEAYPSMLWSLISQRWLLDACAHRRHLGCRGSQDCFGRAHSSFAGEVHRFHWDHVRTRWRGDVPEADTSTLGQWTDGHSHSSQAFWSTLQVAAFVREVAEQEVTGSQWDWNARQPWGAASTWSISL